MSGLIWEFVISKQGKNDDAISAMEKGLKINPKHQIANLNLGYCEHDRREFRKGDWLLE